MKAKKCTRIEASSAVSTLRRFASLSSASACTYVLYSALEVYILLPCGTMCEMNRHGSILKNAHLVGVILSACCFRLWPSQDVQAVDVDYNSRLAQICPWDLQRGSTYIALPRQRHVSVLKGNYRSFILLQLICNRLPGPSEVPHAILDIEVGIPTIRTGLKCRGTHLQCERSKEPRFDGDGEVEVC